MSSYPSGNHPAIIANHGCFAKQVLGFSTRQSRYQRLPRGTLGMMCLLSRDRPQFIVKSAHVSSVPSKTTNAGEFSLKRIGSDDGGVTELNKQMGYPLYQRNHLNADMAPVKEVTRCASALIPMSFVRQLIQFIKQVMPRLGCNPQQADCFILIGSS